MDTKFNYLANPDPREEPDNSELPTRFGREGVYDNQPRYWLARPVNEEGEIKVWTDYAKLVPPYKGYILMHQLGESDGIPVIHYDYWVHSGVLSYGCDNKSALLEKMSELGVREV